jgi:hypothetical protein
MSLSARHKVVSRKACSRRTSHSTPRGHNTADDRLAPGPKGGHQSLSCRVGTLGKDPAIPFESRLASQTLVASENNISYPAAHRLWL